MKSITLFTVFVFLLFVVISCKDDDNTPETEPPLEPDVEMPSIAVTAPDFMITDNVIDISVTKDSTITLDYSVTAPGIIQQFTRTVDGVEVTVPEATGEEEYSGQFVIDIPYSDNTLQLELEVADNQGQITIESISITVEAI